MNTTKNRAVKKISGLLIVAMCSTLFLPTAAHADAPIFITSDSTDGSVTITGCTANCSGALVIPGTIGGKTVTRIGNSAFWLHGLTSVTIPSSVTSIDNYAFEDNGLTSVTIPSSVTNIGRGAFWYDQLTSVTIPSSVKTIGECAFCNNQLTSVTFLGDAPTDGGDIFSGAGNSGLSAVVVPSDAIGFGATFSGVTVSRTGAPIHVPVFTTSDNSDGSVTITGCTANCSGALVIPGIIGGKTVTAIGDSAFWLKGLTSVTIPSSVTSIDNYAFEDNQLTSVTIPDSVTSIGRGAFWYNQLTSVTIPSSVKTIGDSAFQSNQLTSVTFLGDAPTAGTLVFGANATLLSVVVPSDATGFNDTFAGVSVSRTGEPIHGPIFTTSDNTDGTVTITGCTNRCSGDLDVPSKIAGKTVNAIDDFAFAVSEFTSLTIPSSVKSIGNNAFFGSQLTSVTIPNSVTSIGDSAFSGNQLTAVTIPNSVKSIGSYTFSLNKLASVTIPSSVTTIGDSAFANNLLTSITIPSSVKSIVQNAFQNNLLTSVSIPSSVTSIDMYAFQNNLLTSVTFLGDAPSDAGYIFDRNPNLTAVVVPRDATGFGATFSDITVMRTGAPIHGVNPSPSASPSVSASPSASPKAPGYQKGATISGTAKVGKSITAKVGTWKGTPKVSFTYQWYTCSKAVKSVIRDGKIPTGCKAIAAATKLTFKLTAKQKKAHVAVLISAKNSFATVKILTASLGRVQ